MDKQYKRLRGMPDVLPADMPAWHAVEQAVRNAMSSYGYAEMRTPLLERTSLFERSIGESTDIVEKEMYTFPDRKGERMTLRPENTASFVRAVIENGLLQPGASSRVWYLGPMFRYERPQLGRQRQFHQAGAEVYGIAGPVIECELMLLCARLWRELGVADALTLEINTLGTSQDRDRWRAALVAHFTEHEALLDDDSRRRLTKNPLRILDSKNPELQSLIESAPSLEQFLADDSSEHFKTLRALLDAAGISYVLNPRLVRGLDYYSHTVFEWTTDRLGAQSAVCSGGRYDGLLTEIGAKDTPGVGWAMGLERMVALMDALGVSPPAAAPDAFLIASDEVAASDALALGESLRLAMPALSLQHNTAGGSMKSQFRKADKSGASVAVVVGATEIEANEVTLKPMRGDGEQQRVAIGQVPEVLASMLKAPLGDSKLSHNNKQ